MRRWCARRSARRSRCPRPSPSRHRSSRLSTQTLRFVPEPYDGTRAQRFVRELADEEAARYGGVGSSEEPPDPDELRPPGGAFVVAYDGDEPVGCGGLRRLGHGVAELKRMYVAPGARGRGVGRALLAELERIARESGYDALRLETGTRQPEALGLYRSSGYEPVPCWGAFASDPWSRCFEKRL